MSYAKYVNELWLWNWGHYFRFRQQNLCKTPPSGEIMMTSYPACNKTALSRKPCFPDKKLLWSLSGSHDHSFRIRHEKSPETPPGKKITVTSYPACNKTSLSQKPCVPDKKLLWNAIRKSWSLFQNPSWKIAWSAPVADWRWHYIRLAIKPRYIGNLAYQIQSNYGTLSGSLGRSFWIRHEKSRAVPPGGEITMTSYLACNKTSLSRKPFILIKSYHETLWVSHGRSFRIADKKLLWITIRKSYNSNY